MPASWARCSGPAEASTSFGATRIASGLLATTASMIGFCSVASKASGPCTSTVAPNSAAASCTPHSIEM